MQCFRVGYHGIYHASLVFKARVYTTKIQVTSGISHEKALHNYFIPCLNLRKTYEDFGKISEISANSRKLRKRFKRVFEEFKRFMKLLENVVNS